MIVATPARHLLLVGGGHAHVQVLKAFATNPPANCRMTLVTAERVAMYSGMAPGFVAGDYALRDLSIDLRPLAAACGAELVEATCERIDPTAKQIQLAGGEVIGYDVASFNIGSTLLGRELSGVGEHALPTRPLRKLLDGIAGLIVRAGEHRGDQPFRLLVVGAGVAGVELAFCAQVRLWRETGKAIAVTLFNSGSRILPRYPDSLIRRVERLATTRGIVIKNDVRVVALDDNGAVTESGERADADAVLWVTGPVSHPLFVNSPGIETDTRGFISIRSTLQFKDNDDCFAVGDCGTLIEHPDTPKAGVYAVRQGPILTENLRSHLCGESLREYAPQREFLTLLNMGDGYAIGCKLGVSFGGRWVLRLKDWIDRDFMRKFQLGEGTESD